MVILKKKMEKEVIRRHTRLRETDDLAIWGAPAMKCKNVNVNVNVIYLPTKHLRA